MNKYKLAVEVILWDLKDRRGLGDEWYGIDDDIQQEIKEKWEEIIKEVLEDEAVRIKWEEKFKRFKSFEEDDE